MKSEKKWETESLEWIHKVRQEIDEEIQRKGMTPSQWIRKKGEMDIEELCHKMGLRNVTIISQKSFPKKMKAH